MCYVNKGLQCNTETAVISIVQGEETTARQFTALRVSRIRNHQFHLTSTVVHCLLFICDFPVQQKPIYVPTDP